MRTLSYFVHIAALATLIFAGNLTIGAQNVAFGASSRTTNPALPFTPAFDIPLLAVTGLGAGSMSLFEKDLAPDHCRWCGTNELDRSVRNQLRWSNSSLANTLSHVGGYGLAPIFALGSHALIDWKHDELDTFYGDASAIGESAFTAALAAKVIQISFGRERPDAHFATPYTEKSEYNTSFYSTHSTIAFALATSSGMVASMRHRDEAPLIWTGGLLIAGATSYLRIAADRHYFTDVLVGAAAGAAIGLGIPYFLHSPRQGEASSVKNSFQFLLLPSPRGLIASADWKW